MGEPKLTPEDLRRIVELVAEAGGVTAFRLKYGEVELELSRGDGAAAPATQPDRQATSPAATATSAPRAAAGRPAGAGDAPIPAGAAVVRSPMIGTFYRAPAPGAPPFVEVGARVEADTVVCIIEVMKLMNSIVAGARGTVREIRVDDAERVAQGQVLLVIAPD